MPSALPLPTIDDLLEAFRDAVHGTKDTRANLRTGSCYDHFAGIGALLFSRQAQRDRDLFRAIYFDTADGDDLTNQGLARYGIPRVLDSNGIGTATLARSNAAAGGGTIYSGTRILYVSITGTTESRVYIANADTPVGPNDTSVTLPVRASVSGPLGACNVTAGSNSLLRFDDQVFDPTLAVTALRCATGTGFELAKDYRARVRQTRADSRKGYPRAILNTLAAAGATQAVLFPGNYSGDANDNGLNYIYVGDANYVGSPALVTACVLALDTVGIFGTGVQVLPLATSSLTVTATVTLWDDPGNFNLPYVRYDLQQALAGYFDGRSNAFTYRLDAMAGAMVAANSGVQSVTFTSPSSDLTLTTGTPPQFPSVLTRTTLAAGNVLLAFQGPT